MVINDRHQILPNQMLCLHQTTSFGGQIYIRKRKCDGTKTNIKIEILNPKSGLKKIWCIERNKLSLNNTFFKFKAKIYM